MIQRELTVTDFIEIGRRRWLLLLLAVVLGSATGFLVARALPKRYTSKTLVLVQQPTVSADLVKPVVSDNSNQRLAAMQQQILSRSRLEPVLSQLGLYSQDVGRVSVEDLVERLRSTITVTPVEAMAATQAQHLPGFTIEVEFDDPHAAQQICARVTDMFLEENLKSRQDQAEQTTDFLNRQLTDAKANLDQQDAKLATFKRLHMGSLPEHEQTNLNLLTGLTAQLEGATQALARAQQDKSFVESMLAQQLATWQGTQTGLNPQTLDLQLAALQTQLVTLQSKYTDDHPDVIKAKNDIVRLKDKIAQAESQQKPAVTGRASASTAEPPQIQQLRAQIRQYEQVIRDRSAQQEEIQKQSRIYQQRVQSTPAVEQEYKLLTRDYQTALDFYNDLMKKRDESAMATDLEKQKQGEQFEVLDRANLPGKPSFPNPIRFIGGGFGGGLALGFGLTLLLEFLDTSLKTERDIEATLRLPVLAMIPQLAEGSGKAKQATLLGFPRSKAG